MKTLQVLALALAAGWGDHPAGSLGIRTESGWVTWWEADRAPSRWTAPDPVVNNALRWRRGTSGIEWAELELNGSGEAWRTRAVVVRIDPRQVSLRLANGVAPGGSLAVWSVDEAPDDAVLSLNAGQFAGGAVWGWVVHEGVEYRPPGRGPLAAAVIIEADGSVRLADDGEVARRRADGGPNHPARVVEAFQSYPLLLEGDGRVPSTLLEGSPYIDLTHRDARLALGALADGRLVVALTRFDALGPAFGGVPFGLTIPEMSAVMGALGCRWAVALDGGVSAQLALRDSAGTRQVWRGLRRVPLALIATPRP
jgi:hypothetical protein